MKKIMSLTCAALVMMSAIAVQSQTFKTTYIGTSATNLVTLQPDGAGTVYTLTLPPNDGSANEVLTTNGSGILSWASAMLTNFTEALTTAAPNAGAWPVASLTASNAASNVDAALIPKGTGALLASIPDGAATGGDKRGSYAVDWQLIRSATTQVASGTRSTISGGADNSASAGYSTVGGGSTNSVTDDYGTVNGGQGNGAGDAAGTTADRSHATVGGGNGNGASGQYSTIGGGTTNMAGATNATIGGGNGNTASGISSTIGGGNSNTASGVGSFIGGGGYNGVSTAGNTASGTVSVVSGGYSNTASGGASTVGGGSTNLAMSSNATVSGGSNNQATAQGAVVGGGELNTASALESAVAGGLSNETTDDFSFVGGGQNNQAGDAAGTTADRSHATVGGGSGNTASGQYSSVGGGLSNTASDLYAVVSGGNGNTAAGVYSAIPGGRGLTLDASADRSFGFLAYDGTNAMTISDAATAVFGNADLWLANNDNAARGIVFFEAYNTAGAFPNTANRIRVVAPSSFGPDYTLTLPPDDGATSQVLTTNGTGTLSWSDKHVLANATDPGADAGITLSNAGVILVSAGTATGNFNVALPAGTDGQLAYVYNNSGFQITETTTGTVMANATKRWFVKFPTVGWQAF